MQYVVNPKTNRHIKVDGPTYLKLKDKYDLGNVQRIYKSEPHQRYKGSVASNKNLQQMSKMNLHKQDLNETLKYTTQPHLVEKLKKQIVNQNNGRGSKTRGWSSDVPKRGSERHLLKKECGDKCFLMPEDEGFPICPKCFNNVCKCEIDCRGLTAAKIRAKQHKYNQVSKAVETLEKKTQCGKK